MKDNPITTYRISNNAKKFARYSKYHSFLICEDHIAFNGKTSSQLIDYLSLTSHVTVHSGWFWDALKFNTTEAILFGGVDMKVSESLCDTINQQIKKFTSQKMQQNETAINDAAKSARSLLANQHYIRHAEAQNWFSTYDWLSINFRQNKFSKKLSSAHKKDLEIIKPLLDKGYPLIEKLNAHFVAKQLEEYKAYFDQVETNPLTENQRKACVIDEKYNLVLAGAGTGKTSTMVGRAGYLLKSGLAKPNETLMLAYANKAAQEMDERIREKLGIQNLTVKTFHSLGLEIIGQVEGKKPSIHEMATDEHVRAKFLDSQFQHLLKNKNYQNLLIHYFANLIYPYKSQYEFKSLSEYSAYILENDMRTLQSERVKSYEELEIANFLYRQGVNYQYETKYKIDTRTPDYKQYQPDFYLPDYDIYIEHFAVDQQNKTPPFIDQTKYLQGMAWKRALHQKHQTKLIETYSYYKQQGRLTEALDEKLTAAGVQYKPLPANQLLANLNAQGQISEFSKLMVAILSLFKSACLTLQELKDKFANSENKARAEATIQLFEPIYNAYQTELKNTNSIDFDDMIARAIEYIEAGRYESPYLYLLVDEFQDISASRARLLKALIAQQADASLFCVGDDWQAIYRFTGSDVSLTKDFSSHFGYTATSILDKTFRFNNKIGEVASRFISENPSQIQKIIHSHTQIETSAVSIVKTNNNEVGLDAALKKISEKTSKPASVLLLGRNNFNKPTNLNAIKKQYTNLHIASMTAHESKGKEADYVIVLNLIKGKHGFPAEKVTNPLLAILLPKAEDYKHAEERRLFYVALTRARHHVYLITDANQPSPFVVELIDNGYPIMTDEFEGHHFQDKMASNCPNCKTGFLTARDGYSSFFGCSNYPVCKHTEKACKRCGSSLITKGELRLCENKRCDYIEPICPSCDGTMIFRKNGNFWGCSNYRKDSDISCGYTTKFIDLGATAKP